jgi:hypothetical protein
MFATTVGIFRSNNGYCVRLITDDTTDNPIYRREFAEPILALGYCSVLNRLSKTSIDTIISKTELTECTEYTE